MQPGQLDAAHDLHRVGDPALLAGLQRVDRHDPRVLELGGDLGLEHEALLAGGVVLEAAAVLRKLECEVTLVEAEDRLLSRVAGEDMSRFFAEEHRRQGVDVRLFRAERIETRFRG